MSIFWCPSTGRVQGVVATVLADERSGVTLLGAGAGVACAGEGRLWPARVVCLARGCRGSGVKAGRRPPACRCAAALRLEGRPRSMHATFCGRGVAAAAAPIGLRLVQVLPAGPGGGAAAPG